jgi:hypothetical protein
MFTLPSSLLLLPWLLLDPVCQIYGGLLVRIGTAGVLHLNVQNQNGYFLRQTPTWGCQEGQFRPYKAVK